MAGLPGIGRSFNLSKLDFTPMPPVPTAVSTSPSPAQQEFTRLLRELFQLDQSDLDFGIYRIMRLRAKDVEAFITDELPKALQAAREELATRGLDEVRAARDEARQQLQQNFALDVTSPQAVAAQEAAMGAIPIFRDTLARYRDAQTQLEQAALAEELERTIYQDLYRFFARYYDSGDFVTQPRAGEAAYMLPYNGEEVKLYWANHDQYYIKTGENFRHYRFEVGRPDDDTDTTRLTVDFELTDADTAAGNNLNKKGRVFFPASLDDYFQFNAAARRLTLRFRFAVPTPEEAERWGTKQSVAKDEKGVNERIINDVAERIQATSDAYLIDFWRRNTHRRGEQPVNAFVYHLHRYTLPNHFDYFIHRNLGRFLGQELDYYLKHELLDLQFLSEDWSRPAQLQAMQQQLLRVSVMRSVALRLIAFLHELEEYQRHLFEKKKLVVGAEYCISLDLLPGTVRPDVLQHLLAGTEPAQLQLKAWQTLGMVPDTDAGATALRDWLTQALAAFDDTAAYARLPLDTQYLTQASTEPATALRDSILGAFEDLEGQTTCVLINSENWQALNVLQAKYREQIECVYIDPPYNTDAGPIMYKNGFRNSSWMALMDNRLDSTLPLMRRDGILCATIDDFQQKELSFILSEKFPGGLAGTVPIRINPSGRPTQTGFALAHEYAIFARKSDAGIIRRMARSQEQLERFDNTDDDGVWEQRNFRRDGSNSERTKRRKLYYPIFVKGETLRVPELNWNEDAGSWDVTESAAEDEVIVWPVDDRQIERTWRWKNDRVRSDLSHFLVKTVRGKLQIYYKYRPNMEGAVAPTIWVDSKYSATEYGTALIKKMFGENAFSYPKSLHAVEDCLRIAGLRDSESTALDYFAGSGTTGHAVINLNREDEDDGSRRFILVEMGEYFDTVTKPRVLKASYSNTWQNGTAHEPTAGMSQLVQVLRLEQYEDTLNNMEFAVARDEEAKQFFADSPENQLRYVLTRSESGSKATLGPALLTQPFNYELCIVLANERKPVAVDLVASFNLLLGLHVERLWVERGPDNRLYRLVRGHRRGQRYLCIWRDAPGHGQSAETEEAALAAERDWVQAQSWYQHAQEARAIVYCNAQQLFGAESAEAELHRLLFATV